MVARGKANLTPPPFLSSPVILRGAKIILFMRRACTLETRLRLASHYIRGAESVESSPIPLHRTTSDRWADSLIETSSRGGHMARRGDNSGSSQWSENRAAPPTPSRVRRIQFRFSKVKSDRLSLKNPLLQASWIELLIVRTSSFFRISQEKGFVSSWRDLNSEFGRFLLLHLFFYSSIGREKREGINRRALEIHALEEACNSLKTRGKPCFCTW